MSNKTVQNVTVRKKSHQHINKSRTVPEVFDLVRQEPTNEDKVKLLQAYNTKALQFVVNGLYNVDWEGLKVPKYTPNHRPPEICSMNLNNSVKKIESAYKLRYTNPKVSERNLLLVLEELSADEAELLVNIIKGKKVEGISKSVFKKTFPAFFRHEQTTESS